MFNTFDKQQSQSHHSCPFLSPATASWEFPLCAVGASLLLAVLSFAPLGAHSVVCPLVWSLVFWLFRLGVRKRFSAKASGIIFGLGLGVSGMTSQAPVEVFSGEKLVSLTCTVLSRSRLLRFVEGKVLNFLDVAGYWDPSLAFVMGCGIMVSFPAFYMADCMVLCWHAQTFFACLLNQTSPFCSGFCPPLCRRKRKMQSHGAPSLLRSRAKRVTMKLCCSRAQS